ncbi:hypothetical protein ONS95_008640 [Cadophora gregata]|uniref:uncharacterized protein n=1 Tax=Cadophora gregata TaxID=51156 RepID=UPI0026DA93DA|nr:uncharacterized protein ONS95_008640 [Cadophora gregata]KAK0123624.1 hypothetical protein ONS95_008640 [Cadophora gregata]KAK0129964.1 hypothetical protein ONS96_000505 [Cadophora gregata f. sp. sojae]
MVLEEYDATLKRDMPFHIKVKFRQFRSQFKRVYAATGVGDALLEHLKFVLETGNYTSFIKFFKVAVDKMDNQYLEILRARQELFMWDVPTFNDRQYNIDPQPALSTDNVDWEHNEPELTPLSSDAYEPSDVGNWNENLYDGQDAESDDDAAPGSEDGSREDENESLNASV